MSERSTFDSAPPTVEQEETLEQKRERLLPIFEQAMNEGRLIDVTCDVFGNKEVSPGMVVFGIEGDDIELSWLEADGGYGDSAWMSLKKVHDAVLSSVPETDQE